MKQKKQRRKKNSGGGWLLIGAVILVGVVGWYVLRTPNDPARDAEASRPVAGVNTLDPAGFTGKARESYQVAKDIPQILNQLPCYCGCMNDSGHKNNLYCFTDNHGVGWAMCQDIALDARRMYDNGLTIDRIRDHIRGQYARYAPR